MAQEVSRAARTIQPEPGPGAEQGSLRGADTKNLILAGRRRAAGQGRIRTSWQPELARPVERLQHDSVTVLIRIWA